MCVCVCSIKGNTNANTSKTGTNISYRRKKRTKEENRALHKAVERRRTRKINDLIANLKLEMEV